LEVYDLELDADVSQVGIHTTPFLEPDLSSPEAMVERVRVVAYQFFAQGKLVVTLGGDHSVTIGAVKAAKQVWSDLSVLYLDAHADMRDSYMGTRWGHASTARRIQEMCPITLVGVRSMSEEEQSFLNKSGNSIWTYTGAGSLPPFAWLTKNLSSHVYISVDLDVFDPPLMAAVGTPEPGGPSWHEVLGLLKEVARHWHVVGFDATELAPQLGPPSCSYIAAKLVYKMMAYTCFSGKGRVV
jgi:agmatinase